MEGALELAIGVVVRGVPRGAAVVAATSADGPISSEKYRRQRHVHIALPIVVGSLVDHHARMIRSQHPNAVIKQLVPQGNVLFLPAAIELDGVKSERQRSVDVTRKALNRVAMVVTVAVVAICSSAREHRGLQSVVYQHVTLCMGMDGTGTFVHQPTVKPSECARSVIFFISGNLVSSITGLPFPS